MNGVGWVASICTSIRQDDEVGLVCTGSVCVLPRTKGLREALLRERRDWVVVRDCFLMWNLFQMESSSLIFFTYRTDRFPDGEAWCCVSQSATRPSNVKKMISKPGALIRHMVLICPIAKVLALISLL